MSSRPKLPASSRDSSRSARTFLAVRRLEEVLHGSEIDLEDQLAAIEVLDLRRRVARLPGFLRAMVLDDLDSPIVPMRELERREADRALRYLRGDVTEAARLLGIGRATMYRIVREAGIPVALYRRTQRPETERACRRRGIRTSESLEGR